MFFPYAHHSSINFMRMRGEIAVGAIALASRSVIICAVKIKNVICYSFLHCVCFIGRDDCISRYAY